MNIIPFIVLLVLFLLALYQHNKLKLKIAKLDYIFTSALEFYQCSCGRMFSKVKLRSAGILVARCLGCGNEIDARPCTCYKCIPYGPLGEDLEEKMRHDN